MLVAVILCGAGSAWGETTTVTASKIASSPASWKGSKNETWNVAVNGGATNQNVTNSYAQVGTKNSPSSSIAFSTSGISGTITSIVIDCAAYNGSATVSATVGGTAFGTQSQSVPSWSNNSGGEVTFTGSASGAIVVTMTNGSSGRAMYIKSITVTYSEGGTQTVATPTFSPAAGAYTSTQNVTITCETAGATIYYTTDGADPTAESAQYTDPITVSQTTTIKAMAVKSGMNNSTVASATYTITQPLTTMDEIFAAAGKTAAPKVVTFNNWVVSAVNGNQVFVTDGTKGFIVYQSNHGFEVGDVLSGTVSCNLVLYNGSAEITGITSTTAGLTVTAGGTVSAANIELANLSGVNTGALVSYQNLTCTVSTSNNYTNYNLSDGTTTITAHTSLYDFTSDHKLEDGKTYNITGIFNQNNTIKRVLPRSAEDIVEVVSTVPVIDANNVTIDYNATSGQIEYTIENEVEDVTLQATTDAGWLTIGNVGNGSIAFTCSANEGTADRAATITLAYEGAESKTVTVTQKHYVVDFATLPFEWEGGASADLLALNGVTASGLGSDYGDTNAPYHVKLDHTGDYIQVKTDERPGIVTIDVKMIGGASTSTITVQESADGETFTDVQALTISGAQNDILNLSTTTEFAESSRYVRLLFTKGSNVGVGPISIAKYSEIPAQTVITKGNMSHVSINELWDGDSFEPINLNEDVEEDTKVYFSLNVEEGYDIESVTVLDATNTEVSLTEASESWWFTMPNSSVTINATATKSSVTPVTGDKYVKVTSTSDLTSGQYLIVYEEGSVAFDGSLETLDAASNTIGVTISNNEIAVKDETTAAEFTIDVAEGTIKSASGYYIGQTTDANGLASNKNTAYTNTISFTDGNAVIVSSDAHLRYNSASNQLRFRYYKSTSYTGQKAIQLYKKVEATPETVNVTVSDAGYATFCSDKALDFTNSQIKAFIGTRTETSLVFRKIDKVPANTGILLYMPEGKTEQIPVATTVEDTDGNCLVGVTAVTTINSDDYILSRSIDGVGFYKAGTHTTLGAHRAYIQAAAVSEVKNFSINFGGDTDAIENLNINVNDNATIYNIAGQRVGKMTKGIYVVNGKKVIVK